MAFYKNGAFVDDPWAARDIMTLTAWQERRQGPLPLMLGLQLDPGAMIETIAPDLGKFDLIKLAFPKFTDGRGYSMGWLLRTRFNYKGEMRAVGDVLFDEMQFMLRCGFDAFEIEDPATLDLLREGRNPGTIDRFYQPGVSREIPSGTRPWLRRPG